MIYIHYFFSLCDDYELIAEKALTTPANTEQLMELQEYIKKVENDTIFVLEKRLVQAKNRLAFLVDYANFSPAEMRLNSNTFMWHGRMGAIFEEHRLIAQEKKAQYEEALKLKRDRFQEELESYAKQLEEFQTFGDMNEISRYLRKAQQLDSKLTAAADKIEAFNVEEESFGWEVTSYPNRQETLNTLKPYLNLYQLTVDFNDKYKGWMEGPMEDVDPDAVENEVGNIWRNLYKLEKGFESVPASKKICQKVQHW